MTFSMKGNSAPDHLTDRKSERTLLSPIESQFAKRSLTLGEIGASTVVGFALDDKQETTTPTNFFPPTSYAAASFSVQSSE